MGDQDGQPWECGGDLPWATPETDCQTSSETWRGELHQDDWPEDLAGPEYWLYKRQRDE